ncbi:MAG: hypothetical protein WCK85_11880 [Chlorobium sp.]
MLSQLFFRFIAYKASDKKHNHQDNRNSYRGLFLSAFGKQVFTFSHFFVASLFWGLIKFSVGLESKPGLVDAVAGVEVMRGCAPMSSWNA